MNNTLLISAAAAIVYTIYFILIRARNKVREASAGIDVQLKKRHDLIPNILKMAEKFMTHERGLMEEITRLRTEAMGKTLAGDGEAKVALENLIDRKMADLMVSVENYPDLKSNQTMVQAMGSFESVEEHIAAARRFYNSAVLNLKNMVDIFPMNLVAKLAGVKDELPFFAAAEEEKKAVDAADFFK